MLNRLTDRVIVVTGAGSGFGRAIALRAVDEGAKVVVADRDEAAGRQTVDLIEARAAGASELVVADVSREAGAMAAVRCAVDRFGAIHVLVNNAGVAPPEPADSWDATEDSWDRVIRINLKSVYLCSRAAIPLMLAAGSGSIVNVASIAATRACSCASYATAKAGMIGYTHQVAAELASRNVRINCVSPGFMRTPMSTGERKGLDPAAQAENMAAMARGVPMQRMGEADDIAAAVAYLASDDAGYVTGQEIVVDGGFLCAPAFPAR